jgi:hypothetical protein
MAPLLARYLVRYLVPSDGAPAHDRRWLYSKICARCVGRGVVCWQLMAAMAMGRFRFTRRGGGLPRRATDSGASRRAAAGRRRARGCARCGLRLGYQLYRIIAVPITYWYLLLRSRCTGAGSLLARSGPVFALSGRSAPGCAVACRVTCARRCSAVMRTWVCRDDVRSRPPVLRCIRDPCGTVSYVRSGRAGVA